MGLLLIASAAVSPSAAISTHVEKLLARNMTLIYNITAIDAAQTVNPQIIGIAPDGSEYVYWDGGTLSATGINVAHCGPGSEAEGTSGTTTATAVPAPIPRNWYLKETFGDVSGTKPITRQASIVEAV